MRPADLTNYKKNGRKIIMLTAWDSISSSQVEAAGADIILVGDSLAMVVLGHSTTLPVTLEQMLHHAKAVERGLTKPISQQPLIVCDLPFLSYQCGEDKAVAAAGTLLKKSSVCAVKIEGAEPEVLTVIERLVRMGIPVMGHLGLTPQSVHNLGYRRQAEDSKSQEILMRKSLQLEKAGCFALVIEHVPPEVATRIKDLLKIPLIGIGAGENCDGQVRVTADLLGLTPSQPPFSPPLIQMRDLCSNALRNWVMQQHQGGDHSTIKEAQQKPDY